MAKSIRTIISNGSKSLYKDGELHREDGPAVEYFNGSQIWYLNGKCHRMNGPAVELFDGYRAWWRQGEIHREDGPAIQRPDGTAEWYLNNKLIAREEKPENWNELVLLAQIEQIMNE